MACRHVFVASGHSHRHWLRTFPGITFAKAGTLEREQSPGYAVLDTTARQLRWIALESWEPGHA